MCLVKKLLKIYVTDTNELGWRMYTAVHNHWVLNMNIMEIGKYITDDKVN